MPTLHLIARMKIHDGRFDEFQQLAQQCITTVAEKDSGTLQYDWFIDPTRTHCVVLESYRDSEAVLEHASHVGELLDQLAAICDISLELLGNPTEQLRSALEPLGTTMYRPLPT